MDYTEQGKSNRSSGATFDSGVMQKGDDGGYVTQFLSVWIVSVGHTMITLHPDKEPAICWVRDRVQANLTERGMSVITRASPTHSHEINGRAGRAVQSVRCLARTLVTQVEHRTGLTFGADSPLWLWAFKHVGWILTRFGRRRDTGKTPCAKLFCKQYRPPLLMFAEAVIARRLGAQINKLEHQWIEGLWVGRDGSTDEHLIASGGGIVRCRAVKRMTEDRRWLAARFGSFHWTPWAPSAIHWGRPPRAREDAEPIRIGALGRELQQQLLNLQCRLQ